MAYSKDADVLGNLRHNADGEPLPGPIRPGWNKEAAQYAWSHGTRLPSPTSSMTS